MWSLDLVQRGAEFSSVPKGIVKAKQHQQVGVGDFFIMPLVQHRQIANSVPGKKSLFFYIYVKADARRTGWLGENPSCILLGVC